MKKILAAVLVLSLLSMLTACNQGGVVTELNNPDNEIETNISEENKVDEGPDLMLVESQETVSHYNISLTIPNDWQYEVLKGEDNADYCIAFWPEGVTEGRIKMCYFESFGVCGTDLTEEEITVGDYRAYKGTYGKDWLWSYICFAYTPGSYVAINDGADKWWNQYGEEAMEILSTLRIAEEIVIQ